MSYPQGATLRIVADVKYLGVLANPDTVTFRLQPDGLDAYDVTPTHDGTGVYYSDVTLATAGPWLGEIRTATGSAQGVKPFWFIVTPREIA